MKGVFERVWRPVTDKERKAVESSTVNSDPINRATEKFADIADKNPNVTPDVTFSSSDKVTLSEAQKNAKTFFQNVTDFKNPYQGSLVDQYTDKDNSRTGATGALADYLDGQTGGVDEAAGEAGKQINKTVENVSETVNKTVKGFKPDALFQEFREFMKGAGIALTAAAALTGLGLLAWLASSFEGILGGE